MKLTYEAYGHKNSVEVDHEDVDMEEVYQLVQQLLLGAGFHPQTVEDYFGSDVEGYFDERTKDNGSEKGGVNADS